MTSDLAKYSCIRYEQQMKNNFSPLIIKNFHLIKAESKIIITRGQKCRGNGGVGSSQSNESKWVTTGKISSSDLQDNGGSINKENVLPSSNKLENGILILNAFTTNLWSLFTETELFISSEHYKMYMWTETLQAVHKHICFYIANKNVASCACNDTLKKVKRQVRETENIYKLSIW